MSLTLTVICGLSIDDFGGQINEGKRVWEVEIGIFRGVGVVVRKRDFNNQPNLTVMYCKLLYTVWKIEI